MLAATVNTLVPRLRLQYNKPKIENFVFQLHYKATVTLLLACVILVCAREFFGEHIRCISDEGVPPNVLQTYCFFMATFTIVRHYNETLLQRGALPHPGVGPILDSDETLVHTYYQWVPFVLFLQSLCFYTPHYIWKNKEGGRIKALVDGLQFARLAIEDEDMTVNGKTVPSKSSLQKTLTNIRTDIILRLRISRAWSTWLVAMEVVNLLHVILQIWLINKFLNGQFLSLGPWVLNASNWNHIADPLETVFPKVLPGFFYFLSVVI
ncbi:innexin inx7-like [Hyposmocoma kahamanoa]|uniref:innexin inx7-like n=1 Tax=Hyposmocoma kahamanoa TaxID=1477025 RepID=UPI000E6D8E7D|nr:innexin inx7-like [Hyposmocoma kahamanoa]